MEYHWLLPPQGTIKINIHGATPMILFMNGNTNGIGMIAHNWNGGLKKLSLGSIPNLTPLQNQFWAIQHGLNRAFEEDYQDIVLETDNLEAFKILKLFPIDVPAEVADTAKQILIRLHDPRWLCSIVYVYPQKNKIATYLARFGGERCKQLYTLSRPVGCVEELMSLDLGFGPLKDKYFDVEIGIQEPDPVDFSPIHLAELMHGGYEFEEDVVMVGNGTADSSIKIEFYNMVEEDIITSHGFADSLMGDFHY